MSRSNSPSWGVSTVGAGASREDRRGVRAEGGEAVAVDHARAGRRRPSTSRTADCVVGRRCRGPGRRPARGTRAARLERRPRPSRRPGSVEADRLGGPSRVVGARPASRGAPCRRRPAGRRRAARWPAPVMPASRRPPARWPPLVGVGRARAAATPRTSARLDHAARRAADVEADVGDHDLARPATARARAAGPA